MARDLRKEARVRELVVATQLVAARTVAGLFADPETPAGDPNPAYNNDAEVPWKFCSTRTRAALILVGGAMAAERAKHQGTTTQVFGMVYMQGRIDNHAEWERMAAAIPSGKVLDAVSKQVVPGGARPVRAGQAQLRADLREEDDDGTQAVAQAAARAEAKG